MMRMEKQKWGIHSSAPVSHPVSIQEAGGELRRLLGEDLPSRSLFQPYRPLPQWFLRPDMIGSIHGISHEARVLVWQELLARLLVRDGLLLDQEALRWAAAIYLKQISEKKYTAILPVKEVL